MINFLKRVSRRLRLTMRYQVFEACFSVNGIHLGPDLHNTKFEDGDVNWSVYDSWHECAYQLSRQSKGNMTPTRDDILVLTCHGTKEGYLVLGDSLVDINTVVSSLKATNIRTIVLACCFGDRIVRRAFVDSGFLLIYNHGEIRNDETSIMVKRMIEGLDLWSLKESMNIINTLAHGNSLWGYYE